MPQKARHPRSEVREALPLFAYARAHARAAQVAPLTSAPVPTGLASLDEVTGGGFSPGRLGLVIGRPKVGGSSLLLGSALACLKRGLRVAYLSERLNEAQLRGRLVVLESRVNGYRFKAGLASSEDRMALVAARERILWQKLSLVAERTTFEGLAEHLFEYRPALAVLDCAMHRPGDVRDQAKAAARLSEIAAEHGVALLWRHVLSRGHVRPEPHEMPVSEVLEPCADVLVLHREEVTLSGGPDGALGWAELELLKKAGAPYQGEPLRLRFDQRFAGLLDP